MAGISMMEAEETSHQQEAEGGGSSLSQEVDIFDVDETYSDNECPSDNKETFECVEIKDDDDKEEEDIPRVINLVDETISLNSSISSITEIIEESPSKLRRSARTSVRRYRRSNKASTSESEPEVIFIKKTQKRKGSTPSINRKSKIENDKYDQKTAIKDENIDEKENKNIESEIKLSNKNSKSNREIKSTDSMNMNRTSTSSPIHHKKKTELELIFDGITQIEDFFDESMCRKIEKKIDQIAEKAKCGLYKQKTFDRAPLRNKYFFGEGYTYGKQMEVKGAGKERIYAKGLVDEIPKWIEKHIIQKVYDDKFVKDGYFNSVVINEYFTGGCIVSHIDPIHIFDRPIISISFNCKTYLSFGCRFSFNPIRTTEPILALPLERGCLTSLSGYAADNVTHCIRPQDISDRRCVIILRRVFPDAPRVGDPISPEYPLSLLRRNHPRSHSYENTHIRANWKSSRNSDHYDHGYRSSNQSNKKRKTRHSY